MGLQPSDNLRLLVFDLAPRLDSNDGDRAHTTSANGKSMRVRTRDAANDTLFVCGYMITPECKKAFTKLKSRFRKGEMDGATVPWEAVLLHSWARDQQGRLNF